MPQSNLQRAPLFGLGSLSYMIWQVSTPFGALFPSSLYLVRYYSLTFRDSHMGVLA